MSKTLTQKRLKELLYYDPETGIFTRRVSRRGVKVGSVAGAYSYGYIRITVDYVPYQAHRLAFLYMKGYFPEYEVDHINRIKDDNRWCNLRHVSRLCNSRNCKVAKNSKSGITGVYWYKLRQKWGSYITIKGKSKHLGFFKNKKEAAQARWEVEVKYEYPNCNSSSSAYQFLQENIE
jgi:hypothetical protein